MTRANKRPIDVSKIAIRFPNAGEYSDDDPRFLKELQLLREELSEPNKIKISCIHEVGHLSYFRWLGIDLNIPPDKFRFVGPSVTYGLNKKHECEFDHFVAATEVPFQEDDLDYNDERLLMLAKACFAGGVFVHKLANGSLRGDKDDRKKFHSYYNSAIKQLGQMDVLESQLKKRAIRAVTDDLKTAAIRKQALASAGQLAAEHFS